MSKFFSRGTEFGLLVLATVVFAITLVSLELSQGNVLTLDVLYLIGGFIGVFCRRSLGALLPRALRGSAHASHRRGA